MKKTVKQRNRTDMKKVEAANQVRLTISDLVILSLLAERTMHGYEVNATLEDRTFRKQLDRRMKVVEARLAEERATLADVLTEVGHPYHEAVWMLQLIIEQLEIELRWVQRILGEANKRSPAQFAKRLKN